MGFRGMLPRLSGPEAIQNEELGRGSSPASELELGREPLVILFPAQWGARRPHQVISPWAGIAIRCPLLGTNRLYQGIT